METRQCWDQVRGFAGTVHLRTTAALVEDGAVAREEGYFANGHGHDAEQRQQQRSPPPHLMDAHRQI